MSEHVFIFGAGASKHCGAPLMGNFLDESERLYKQHVLSSVPYLNVQELIGDLQEVFIKADIALDNIEALFGMVEMGITIDKLGNRSTDQMKETRDHLVKMIVETIENTLDFPLRKKYPGPPAYYDKLVKIVRKYSEAQVPYKTVSYLTFNYDIGLDTALIENRVDYDYAVEDGNFPSIKLLKLHGSTNWVGATKNGSSTERRIIPNKDSIKGFLQEPIEKDEFEDFSSKKFPISRAQSILRRNPEYRDYDYDELPIIVPPTWNKTDFHRSLSRVWKQAATELSGARYIYIIGYSMPESDAFFRFLYALGTMGKTILKKVVVIHPKDDLVRARYESMLGGKSSRLLDFVEAKFEDAESFARIEYYLSK